MTKAQINSNIEPSTIQIICMGKLQTGKNHPLQIILISEAEVSLLRDFARWDSKSRVFAEVILANDRTIKEKEYLANLRVELDHRIRSGEANLTIMFMNGVPKIMPKNLIPLMDLPLYP